MKEKHPNQRYLDSHNFAKAIVKQYPFQLLLAPPEESGLHPINFAEDNPQILFNILRLGKNYLWLFESAFDYKTFCDWSNKK